MTDEFIAALADAIATAPSAIVSVLEDEAIRLLRDTEPSTHDGVYDPYGNRVLALKLLAIAGPYHAAI